MDSRHLRAGEHRWPGVVEMAHAMEVRWLDDHARYRGIRGLDSILRQARSKEYLASDSHLALPLDTLGVLASVAVLSPRCRELHQAGNSLLELHAPNRGEPWHLFRWIRRRVQNCNAP